jgi:predicted transcriptional regulator
MHYKQYLIGIAFQDSIQYQDYHNMASLFRGIWSQWVVSECCFMSSKGVITEITEENIYVACRVMSENNIGSVIIVDKNHATNPHLSHAFPNISNITD